MSMDSHASRSLSVEQCHDRLNEANDRYEVRALVSEQGRDKVGAAWKRLDPLTKATLLLTKEFDGRIIR